MFQQRCLRNQPPTREPSETKAARQSADPFHVHTPRAKPNSNIHSTVPEETKEAHGPSHAEHDAFDPGNDQRSLKDRVDSALGRTSEDAETAPADQRAEELMEEGFTVGRRADYHDLAARRQP